MNTTSVIPSLLFNQSLNAMLGRTLMVSVYLPLAPISLVANLLIIVTIWLTKEIRNKSHYIIMSYTIADALFEVMLIIWEIRLGVRIQQRSPMYGPSWLCILSYQQLGLISEITSLLGAALALDRFMCVAIPIFYKTLDSRRYILVVNAIAYTFVIATWLIGMIGTDIYQMWNCENAAFDYNFVGQTLYDKHSTIVAVLIAILYVSAASILMYRYKKSSLIGASQKAEWKQRWEIQAFMSMSTVGLVAIVMRTVQGVSFAIAQDYRGTKLALSPVTLVMINGVMRLGEAVLHLFIYLAIDTGFCSGFKKNVLYKVLRRDVVQQISPAK